MGPQNDDEQVEHADIERLLSAAFHARACSTIQDDREVPAMSEPLGGPAPGSRRRRSALWSAAAVVAAAAVAGGVLIVTHRSDAHHQDLAAAPSRLGTSASTPGTTSTASGATSTAPGITSTVTIPGGPVGHASTTSSLDAGPAAVVHVTALESDGVTYGVGMPVVLYFSPVPTNAAAFEKAVRVTVDRRPADGAWYWEQPTADEVRGHVVEAHFRPKGYWPADSKVHVSIPIGGLSAEPGLKYSGKLSSLDYSIGDAHVSLVDARRLTMRVTSNGRVVRTVPVSLGAAATPTFNGVKVVMQKGEDVPGADTLRPNGTVLMSGPGYTDHPVQWSVRITRSGEYVHAAPWNTGIGEHSTSNGCTNLHTSAAKWFYAFSQLGDVVQYVGTDGTRMPTWDGLGDWNMPWSQWRQGGLLKS